MKREMVLQQSCHNQLEFARDDLSGVMCYWDESVISDLCLTVDFGIESII